MATANRAGDQAETDETYLLGPGDVNVKIRFGLLDIKKLIDVDDYGLELWTPISKHEFPTTVDEAASVFDAWSLPLAGAKRPVYDVNQFLQELVTPQPALDIASVHKSRSRYLIGGCMAEITSLVANGNRTTTIAVEAEDPAAIPAVVEMLGLSGHRNVSYGQGLRCLLGLAPVRYGVVDIGTNSVKFHIGEQHTDATWTRVVDRAKVSRLGEGLDETGEIQAEALERTISAVEGMVAESEEKEALAIAAVGTAALRIASNSTWVVDSIKERTGVKVEVVSGEEESRLAYLAITAGVGLPDGAVVVVDTGGGSTQFTFGGAGDVYERFSLNVGAVRYTERFGLDQAVDQETIEEARRMLADDLSSLDGRPSPNALVGMGGAMTNLTAVSLSLAPYDPDVVQGAVVTFDEVERQIALFRSMGHEDRRGIVGLQANRAPVILAGALIVATVMQKLEARSLVVSDRGLRHGLIRERFGMFLPF